MDPIGMSRDIVTTPNKSYNLYIRRLMQVLYLIDQEQLTQLIGLINAVYESQNTIFFIGNGGSASTASHWSNDLSKGLFHRTGMKLKTLSLTDNFSWISAIANDIGYEHIFSDQLKTLASEKDLLVSISASGNSPNILAAIQTAKQLGVKTLSIVGFDGGKALGISDYCIHIATPLDEYGIVEDVQQILNHFVFEYFSHRLNQKNIGISY
jgi:D-sedoheptulose 7-phosphate isomerase